MGEIRTNRRDLNDENEAICQLGALDEEAAKHWFDIQLHHDIGYVQHTEAIKVDVEGGTRYTSDRVASFEGEGLLRGQCR